MNNPEMRYIKLDSNGLELIITALNFRLECLVESLALSDGLSDKVRADIADEITALDSVIVSLTVHGLTNFSARKAVKKSLNLQEVDYEQSRE